MAKNKFFYNKVYNVKRNIINAIIIGICVVGIILCFIFTSKFYGNNPNEQKNLDIKSEVTIEVNDTINKEIFFSKLENVNLDEIEIIYPDDFTTEKVGRSNIIIKVNDKNYDSILNVVDTEMPNLVVKNVKINENGSYNPNSFVSKCTDNSKNDCVISFYEAVDTDGNKINYGEYTESGTYNIKISAKDESGNEAIKEAKLTITKKNGTTTTVNPVVEECKYGNANYNTKEYILTVPISVNNCAVSIDLYKDETMTEKINKIMETETIRIKKDVDSLNLKGRFALNRQISTVFNTSGNGLVGYELTMTINITSNNESSNVVSYKLNSDGKRIFINNPYNLNE